MTYEEALAYWYGLVDYEHASARPGDLTLDRMLALLAGLGNPQDRLRIIHIAGSKGKGSTSAMFAAIARAAGLRTGLFTSPHLTRVEERIQIDGGSIDSTDLASGMDEIARAAKKETLRPTFFEAATALGFLQFARRAVDLAVIEVGLGGRLDSTNVCKPLLSVITSISFDHMDQLGTHLASITREKAGIIKSGCPVVSGATAREAREVINAISAERGAELAQINTDFEVTDRPGLVELDGGGRVHLAPAKIHVRTRERPWPEMSLGLLGRHQAANAAVVIAGVEKLRRRGVVLTDQAVAGGLREVRWPARMEVFGDRPMVVLDCAHNVASAQAVVDTLLASFPRCRRHLVFASSGDKDVRGMLEVLLPLFDSLILTQFTTNPRGRDPKSIAETARTLGAGSVAVVKNPIDAWRIASAKAAPQDLICVTGSVFLAGELRPEIAG